MSLNINATGMCDEGMRRLAAMNEADTREWYGRMAGVFLVTQLRELNADTLDDFAYRIAMSDGIAGGETVGGRGVDAIREWLRPWVGVRANVASVPLPVWVRRQVTAGPSRSPLSELRDAADCLSEALRDTNLPDVPMPLRVQAAHASDVRVAVWQAANLTKLVAKAVEQAEAEEHDAED